MANHKIVTEELSAGLTARELAILSVAATVLEQKGCCPHSNTYIIQVVPCAEIHE